MLFIGREKVREKLEDDQYIDASKSHAIFICGKRGSGKSYTMGVLVEELQEKHPDFLKIIIDPMGIFWTMAELNIEQEEELWDWNLYAREYPVKLIVPGEVEKRFDSEVVKELENKGIEFKQLLLNPSDISPEGWCDLFNININEMMGIALYRAVDSISKKFFTIDDIIYEIERDTKSKETTKEALINRLNMAKKWGIFADEEIQIESVFSTNAVNVIDLSTIESGRHGLRDLVVSIVSKYLFNQRLKSRKREMLNLESKMSKVWMFIDEAHNFIPSGKSTLSKEILIRWAKEGRQPGLNLIIATQQPSAVDNEVLSQCDIIFAHKVTNREDVNALNKLNQEYMGKELKIYIKDLNKGECVFVNDEKECIKTVKIRPRKSKHGGGEK